MKQLPTQVTGSDITFAAVLEDGQVYSETFGNEKEPSAKDVSGFQEEFLRLAELREAQAAPAAVFYDASGKKMTADAAGKAFAEALPDQPEG